MTTAEQVNYSLRQDLETTKRVLTQKDLAKNVQAYYKSREQHLETLLIENELELIA